MEVAAVRVGMDETAFATLSYYMVSEMPGTLRSSGITHAMTTIAPPSCWAFFDTPEDFCRLQDDAEDALLTGVDVRDVVPRPGLLRQSTSFGGQRRRRPRSIVAG